MRYTRHTKADLVVFANNRQLTVQSSLTNGRKGRKGCKGPFHRDYVRALEDADRNATFRFLDLPPGTPSVKTLPPFAYLLTNSRTPDLGL